MNLVLVLEHRDVVGIEVGGAHCGSSGPAGRVVMVSVRVKIQIKAGRPQAPARKSPAHSSAGANENCRCRAMTKST